MRSQCGGAMWVCGGAPCGFVGAPCGFRLTFFCSRAAWEWTRSAAVKNWAKGYLPCLTLSSRRPVPPRETPLAAQSDTARSPLKQSLTMRDDQRQHVTHDTSYHEGYKRLLPDASPNGLGRIACLDHCFAIGILRFAGYLAALLFENQCDQRQSSQS